LMRGTGYCATQGGRGTTALSGVFSRNNWNINQRESQEIEEKLISKLQATIRKNAQLGWIVADAHLQAFHAQGFCSPDDEKLQVKEYAFPKFNHQTGSWEDQGPSGWKPYERLSRWVRMPNDSFLTQMPRCSSCMVGDKEKFTGTAHPNAFGQAALAKSVLTTLYQQSLQMPKQ
jgi:hypothetical protein